MKAVLIATLFLPAISFAQNIQIAKVLSSQDVQKLVTPDITAVTVAPANLESQMYKIQLSFKDGKQTFSFCHFAQIKDGQVRVESNPTECE
jgi:hypothetical protein